MIHNGQFRRTRIVATIGPASDDATNARRVIGAGVAAFRVNFSHATRAGCERWSCCRR